MTRRRDLPSRMLLRSEEERASRSAAYSVIDEQRGMEGDGLDEEETIRKSISLPPAGPLPFFPRIPTANSTVVLVLAVTDGLANLLVREVG